MKFKSLKKNKKGFTLVELIVVLAIIAIMVAVSVTQFAGYVEKAETQMNELEGRNQRLETQLNGILEDAATYSPSPAPAEESET